MDRANEVLSQPQNAPRTNAAKFSITESDVGSEAVRPGHMADVEEERHTLLVAAKLVLLRHKTGKAKLDAISEVALDAAVKVAEAAL